MFKRKIIFLISVFIIAVVIIGVVKKSIRKSALENTKITTAIYIKDVTGVGSTGIYVRYVNNRNETIEAKAPIHQDISHLKIGDTIQIKYSTTNNEIVEMINTKYMNKFRPIY